MDLVATITRRHEKRAALPVATRPSGPGDEFPFHVYLSHAAGDFLLAERVWRILESLGLRAYMYEHYTHPGRSTQTAVLGAISDSAEVLCFLTDAGASSAWVHQELGAVQALNKGLIPWVQVDAVQAPGFALLENPVVYDPRNPDGAIADLLWLVRNDFDLYDGSITVECPHCRGFATLLLPSIDHCRSAGEAGRLIGPDPCGRCHGTLYLSPKTLEPIAEQLALSRAWGE